MTWSSLDWTATEAVVGRIQDRIFRAAKIKRPRLEPDDEQSSCPVLRGLGSGNGARLPDSGQLARGRIIAATTGVLISDSVESVIEAERLVSACSCATARAWELRLARSRWAAPSSCANGGRVVVWGRFVAVPRVLATVLAGVNGMLWPRFLIFNVTGGIVWPTTFACAATLFVATAHGAAAGPARFMALALAAAFAILARGPGAPSRGVSHRGRGASFFKIAHARVS